MKTPIDSVSAGSGATLALLNGVPDFEVLDLYALTLNGGTVIRWHGGTGEPLVKADKSYTFTAAGGQSTVANGTYAFGPLIDRGKLSTKIGTEVATLDLTFSAGLTDLINGVPLIPYITARGLDGATLQMFRAFLPSWGQPITGLVIEFSGLVTGINNISRLQYTMTTSAWTDRLTVNMGPDVYQAGCLNRHFDANCGLTPAAFTFAGAVTGSGSSNGFLSNVTNPDAYFNRGTVLFTSGANAGLLRTVKAYANASGQFSFAFGWPNAPAPGDTFSAVRGCLLSLIDCKAQRSTSDAELHFRGQPLTPPAVQGVL